MVDAMLVSSGITSGFVAFPWYPYLCVTIKGDINGNAPVNTKVKSKDGVEVEYVWEAPTEKVWYRRNNEMGRTTSKVHSVNPNTPASTVFVEADTMSDLILPAAKMYVKKKKNGFLSRPRRFKSKLLHYAPPLQ